MSIVDGRHKQKPPRRLTEEEAKGGIPGYSGPKSSQARARRRATALAAGESSVVVADADDAAQAEAQRAMMASPSPDDDGGVTAFALGHELGE